MAFLECMSNFQGIEISRYMIYDTYRLLDIYDTEKFIQLLILDI